MHPVAAVVAVLLVGACSGTPVPRPGLAVPAPTLTPTASPRAAVRPVVRATARPVPRRTSAPAVRPTAVRPPTCPAVPDVGDATQVVLVVASGTAATVRACRRQGGQWVSVLGTSHGHVGYHGLAPVGHKREGDGRTPSGVFGLGLGFGLNPDPGVAFGWRRVGPDDVWVDDPRSRLYNTWQQDPADGRWRSAERLDQSPAYDDAQVVDYNTARVPGVGSAIFLHVDHGGPTAGCVSLPLSQLLAVLRWERPGTVVAIR